MNSPQDFEQCYLPKTWVAIPMDENHLDAHMWVGVVIRRDVSDPGSRLIVLRETFEATVILAASLDQQHVVHSWLELWIQNPDNARSVPLPGASELTNQHLDARWDARGRAFRLADAGAVITTRWENEHPLPLWIDTERMVPIHPAPGEGGSPWALCTDDRMLEEYHLPQYQTSVHRYLTSDLDGKRRFLAVSTDAPMNEHVDVSDSADRSTTTLTPVNPGCGLILLRYLDAVPLEKYLDSLSSGHDLRTGDQDEVSRLLIGTNTTPVTHDKNSDVLNSGWLRVGSHGHHSRLLETLHLKLRLLLDAVEAVCRTVQVTQSPLLSLRPEQFRMRIGPRAQALPWRWASRVTLKDFRHALAVVVPGTDEKYFLPPPGVGVSVYDMTGGDQVMRGTGSVRLRQVIESKGMGVTLEGTFFAQDALEPGHSHVLWMRLPLMGRRLDLTASIESESALAAGEWRFRTQPLRIDDKELLEAIRQSEGLRYESVQFTLTPRLSTPCDLYSLAVLAVRTLLVDDQTTLPMAVDEVMSLAREVSMDHDPEVGLALRVRAVFDRDDRWASSLGPQRLSHQFQTPEDAFGIVPSELWWNTLAMILRAVPAAGPDSTCRDASDATIESPERVFQTMLDDLRLLIVQSSSLLIPDQAANHEIHGVIRNLAARLSVE